MIIVTVFLKIVRKRLSPHKAACGSVAAAVLQPRLTLGSASRMAARLGFAVSGLSRVRAAPACHRAAVGLRVHLSPALVCLQAGLEQRVAPQGSLR